MHFAVQSFLICDGLYGITTAYITTCGCNVMSNCKLLVHLRTSSTRRAMFGSRAQVVYCGYWLQKPITLLIQR